MRRRFVAFLVSLGAGAAISTVGMLATGNEWWLLAIPIALAAGWLRVGTPETCAETDHARSRGSHSNRRKP